MNLRDPQWNVVAPKLFTIYVFIIPEILTNQITNYQFANNFALTYRWGSSELIQSDLQASLDKLKKCSQRTNLK